MVIRSLSVDRVLSKQTSACMAGTPPVLTGPGWVRGREMETVAARGERCIAASVDGGLVVLFVFFCSFFLSCFLSFFLSFVLCFTARTLRTLFRDVPMADCLFGYLRETNIIARLLFFGTF